MKKVDTFMLIVIKTLHLSNDIIVKVREKPGENIFSTYDRHMLSPKYIKNFHKPVRPSRKKINKNFTVEKNPNVP